MESICKRDCGGVRLPQVWPSCRSRSAFSWDRSVQPPYPGCLVHTSPTWVLECSRLVLPSLVSLFIWVTAPEFSCIRDYFAQVLATGLFCHPWFASCSLR